ncbi:hypothetical protein EYF80_012885 [Liparis tanakae]|uniref:Uncharacterized protein n=1 Tax=Liparis tanakae TaxID=230148 RepID=A0A4Z2IHN3_9TELE|nr:hypothetical protein EYF80_012885 [Liparis tanakae]
MALRVQPRHRMPCGSEPTKPRPDALGQLLKACFPLEVFSTPTPPQTGPRNDRGHVFLTVNRLCPGAQPVSFNFTSEDTSSKTQE